VPEHAVIAAVEKLHGLIAAQPAAGRDEW